MLVQAKSLQCCGTGLGVTVWKVRAGRGPCGRPSHSSFWIFQSFGICAQACPRAPCISAEQSLGILGAAGPQSQGDPFPAQHFPMARGAGCAVTPRVGSRVAGMLGGDVGMQLML